MTNNICTDKITGLKGEIMDISTTPGSVEIFLKLENGDIVARKIKELNIHNERRDIE
jgi:hypothetical protein